MQIDDWVLFQIFADRSSAEVTSARLTSEQVPVRIEGHSLENAREAEYWLFVHRSLVHRARWVVAQLPPSDAELDFLATGKLPGADDS